MTYQVLFEQPLEDQLVEVDQIKRVKQALELATRDLEPSNDYTLGVGIESIKETLQSFFKAIMIAIRNAFKNIYELYDKVLGFLGKLKFNIEVITKKLKQASGSPKEQTMKVGSFWNQLTTIKNNQINACEDGSDVIDRLEELDITSKAFFGDYSKIINTVGEKIASVYEKSSGKIIDKDALNASIIEAVPKQANHHYSKISSTSELYKGSRVYEATESLPGGLSIYLVNPLGFGNTLQTQALEASIDDTRLPEYWSKLQSVQYRVKPHENKDKLNSKEFKIKTLEKSEITEILKLCKKMIDEIETYRSGLARQNRDQLDRLEKSGFRLIDSKNSELNTSIYKSALKFSSAYTYWSTGIQKDLILINKSVIQSALMACEKALVVYG